MHVKLQVDVCRPKPEGANSKILWNAERGCHCRENQLPETEDFLETYGNRKIKLLEETLVMHISAVIVED